MKPLGLGAIGSGEIAINSIFKHLVLGDTADKVYMATRYRAERRRWQSSMGLKTGI